MAAKFPFPDAALKSMLKKAIHGLPVESRGTISAALNSPKKPNALMEKTRLLVVCLLAAKEGQAAKLYRADMEEAMQDITIGAHDLALFLQLLGAQGNLLLGFVKRGIPPEKIDILTQAVKSRAAQCASGPTRAQATSADAQ